MTTPTACDRWDQRRLRAWYVGDVDRTRRGCRQWVRLGERRGAARRHGGARRGQWSGGSCCGGSLAAVAWYLLSCGIYWKPQQIYNFFPYM